MSPFKAQIAMMTRLMTREYRDHPVKPRIQTIDASQGSEADAVIILMTRNNGSPGFLRSIRRVNVMTSRAKHFQYFIGNWNWIASAILKEQGSHLQKTLFSYRDTISNFLMYPS
jgi:AAA domain-containing protein